MQSIRKTLKEYYFRQILVCFLSVSMLFGSVPFAKADNIPTGTSVLPQQVDIIGASSLEFDLSVADRLNLTDAGGAAIANGTIVNWNKFDIGSINQVDILQASSTAAMLNRIHNGNPTNILGTLNANGRMFFVNPAGVLFGAGSSINVNQLIASSLDIADNDFINGIYDFTVPGTGAIVNYGTIEASEGVALLGRRIENAGTIQAGENGFVVMAAGDRVLLGEPGSSIIIEMSSVDTPGLDEGQIINTGTGQISSPSGKIVLAAGDIFSTAVDISSEPVKATDGFGVVEQSGTISASGTNGDGGNITLTAGEAVVLGTDSLTTANAGDSGDGGEVIAYSPGMAFFQPDALVEAKGGSESGNGGFLEVSGKKYVETLGQIDLTASNGKNGMFLIDPFLNMEIIAGTAGDSQWTGSLWEPSNTVSQLGIVTLEGFLGSADVTLSTLGTVGTEDGDITFNADRYLNSGIDTLGNPANTSLFVRAADDIIFNAGNGIYFAGDGDVELYAGPEGSITSIDRGKNPPNIWTQRGDIVIEAGSGGIDLGVLQTGTPSTSGERPGEIRLKTINEAGGIAAPGEYDITVQHLDIEGKGYGSVYVESAGNLTINGATNLGGAVQVKTVTTADGEDALSFICLIAEKDVDITGDVFAEAQGDGESVAGVWIGAGTNVRDSAGYPGTVTVNGNIQADASAAGSTKADATIKLYGSVIKLNGNKGAEALGQGSVTYKVGKTDSEDPAYTDPSGYTDSVGAVYVDENGNPIQTPDPLVDNLGAGSRALVIIDTSKDGSCLDCANRIRIILPIAIDDFLTQSKNLAVIISVLVNDLDGLGGLLVDGEVFLDGVTISYNGGTLSLNSDGTINYTPPPGWAAHFETDGTYTDHFEYYALDSDGDVSADSALVTITLTNQIPVANPDGYSVSHNVDLTPAVGTIEGFLPGSGDTDADPTDTLDAVLVGGGATTLGGFVTLNANGTFTYSPPADTANVDDSFSYYVTDSYNSSNITTVTIGLTNQIPVANPDGYSVSHNVDLAPAVGTIEGFLPGSGDTDADPTDTLDAVLVGGGATTLGGFVTLNANGTFTYSPPADTANVDDSFSYYVTDSYDSSNITTVTIGLTNQIPVANPDGYSVSHNVDLTPAVGTIEGFLPGSGDTDADPTDTLDAVLVGGGATTLGGFVTLNANGTFTYSPPADTANVDDSFSYYVTDSYDSSNITTVTIGLTNQIPVANPDGYSVSHNVDLTPAVGTIEGFLPGSGDTDADPTDTLDAVLVGGGATTLGGFVTLNANGTFTYSPPADTANVDDSFSYYVTDSYDSSNITTVTIGLTNQIPVANPDGYSVSHNVDLTPAVGTIEGFLPGSGDTDADPTDTLDAVLVGGGATTLGGFVTLNANGTFTYSPPADTANVDDSFSYYVTDSYDSSNITTVTIGLTNQIPVANPDGYSVSHNVDLTPAVGTIEGFLPGSGDTDADPTDTLDAVLVGGGATTLGGFVTLNANGTFTYSPPADTANVDDSFSYYVTDSYNSSNITTVTIGLTNQIPVANPDSYEISNSSVILSPTVDQGTIEGLLSGSEDIDLDPGDTLDAYLTGGGSTGPTALGGFVTLNANGTFTYNPPADTTGIDTFTYYVTDSYDNSEPTIVTITIGSAPFIPAAPLPVFVEPEIEGCPVLMNAVAMELGTTSETIQVSINSALAASPGIQPCDACARFTKYAGILRDPDGAQMAAMVQVFNELAPADVPYDAAMAASIVTAFADRINNPETPQYATAMEYIDAFVQYIAVLDTEMGSPVGDSLAFVMEKHGAGITESDNANMAAFVATRLEAIGE